MNQAIDNRQNRLTALLVTVGIHTIIFLILWFFIIKTPIPPFPEEGGGTELALDYGDYTEGLGNVESSGMGFNESQSQKSEVVKNNNEATDDNAENNIISDAEPVIDIPRREEKSKVENKVRNMEPVKEDPKPSDNLSNALNAFKSNKSSGPPGGDGKGTGAGNAGSPDGVPDGGGTGGGTGIGPGGNGSYYLKGRSLLAKPRIEDNSQEEGTVVVDITVDVNGKVVKAIPGANGTNTTSKELHDKARQAAMNLKFNTSPDNTKEQRGTYTVVFRMK